MPTTDKERMSRKAKALALLASGLGLFWGTASFAAEACAPAANGNGCTAGNGGCVDSGCTEEEEAEEPECRCLMGLFEDDCGNNWISDSTGGFEIYGWLDQGITFNSHSPNNRINGPVTFNDRDREYQLNQLYLVMEKAVDRDAEEWQAGGRVDVLYGTDYFFTQALGLELEQDGTQRWNEDDDTNRANGTTGNLYGLALPQFYGEVGGNGFAVKAGHFYTIIGYEVVTATGNFFYSHAYTMQYGEPFTHTGVLTTTTLGGGLSMTNGVVQGWDNFDNTNSGVSYLGGLNWANEDETVSLAFGVITGDERGFSVTPPPAGGGDPVTTRFFENRTMYSAVATLVLTDKLTYVIQHDNGFQDDAAGIGGEDAEWYGVNQYLFYQMTDNVKAGLRGEWFRDDDSFRLANGAIDYYEVTAGINWNIAGNPCLLLRPEVRWDWSDGGNAYGDFDPVTGAFTEDDQFLFATDLIWQF